MVALARAAASTAVSLRRAAPLPLPRRAAAHARAAATPRRLAAPAAPAPPAAPAQQPFLRRRSTRQLLSGRARARGAAGGAAGGAAAGGAGARAVAGASGLRPFPRRQRPLRPPAAAPSEAEAARGDQAAAAAPFDGHAQPNALFPALQLYNSAARAKQAFVSLEPGAVKLYVCGVTVYDYSHVGHARVYVAFDVLLRALRAAGYDVTYVRNFTDVDDKILKRAAERGEHPLELAARFAGEFTTDMEALRCLPPTYEPHVSDHIPEIIQMVETIVRKGAAYEVEGGDVYFHVPASSTYGELSGRRLEDNEAGAGGRVSADGQERKRNPADFALWKAAKEGEGVSWDSPWGRGRPGWHIECSAMIAALLGETIDIHGGGADLQFPHHENEMAQSRAAHGEPGGCDGGCDCQFVRYWMHNGFVRVDSEKMSKSLGNFFTIRDVLLRHHPLAMRLFLLQTHYRSPINYSNALLEAAGARLYYIYGTLVDLEEALEAAGEEGAAACAAKAAKSGAAPVAAAAADAAAECASTWPRAVADDLNTPVVLASLSAPLKAVNDLLGSKKGKKAAGRVAAMRALQEALLGALGALGLEASAQEARAAMAEMRALALQRAGLSEAELAAAIEERQAARKAKDFAASDRIRDELAQKGVSLQDTPQGVDWRPAFEDIAA